MKSKNIVFGTVWFYSWFFPQFFSEDVVFNKIFVLWIVVQNQISQSLYKSLTKNVMLILKCFTCKSSEIYKFLKIVAFGDAIHLCFVALFWISGITHFGRGSLCSCSFMNYFYKHFWKKWWEIMAGFWPRGYLSSFHSSQVREMVT